MNGIISEYYTRSHAQQPVIIGQRGVIEYNTVGFDGEEVIHEVPTGLQDSLRQNMRQLYESIVQIDVTVGGEPYSYEIAHLGQGDGGDQEMDISSYSSSIDNAGNAFEIALRALANPQRSYTYIASPGNGMTSALRGSQLAAFRHRGSDLSKEKERRYYATHGSMLVHENDARPLPVVQGLDLALRERGITPTRLRSDSAGAVLAGAHGAAFGKNLQAVHQNVRTNIADRTLWQLGYGMLYIESKQNGPYHTELTADPLSVPRWDELSKATKEEFYPSDLQPHKSGAMLVANVRGFMRGPVAGDPLLKDMTALLRRNPTANILFTNGRDDPLVANMNLDGRMEHVVAELSSETMGKVIAAIITGVGHGPHTFYPQLIESLSKAV